MHPCIRTVALCSTKEPTCQDPLPTVQQRRCWRQLPWSTQRAVRGGVVQRQLGQAQLALPPLAPALREQRPHPVLDLQREHNPNTRQR